MPLSLDLSRSFENGRLQADHRAAEHFRIQPQFLRRLHDADRAERIGANNDEVGVGRLQRANDRREVGRAGWEGLVVDNLESERLGVFASAFASVARELSVLGRQCDGLRLRILCRRNLEETLGERFPRLRPGRQHGEVFRVVKLGVYVEGKEADERLAFLHDDGQSRRVQVGAVGPDDEIDFVGIEQLRVDAGHIRRIRLIVVVHQLDFAAKQTAFGVDLLFPDLGAEQRLFAVRRQRTGERQAKPDLDRIAALRASRCGRAG